MLQATNPATGERLEPVFEEATSEDIDRAVRAAEAAFEPYAALPAERRAAFLRAIGDEILAEGDALLERTEAETGLPRARLEGERGRTVSQLRMFAQLLDEGSWVEARIDRPDPKRQPAPRPDLRRMLVPLGPVAVFGASNFPLAFSVAGGDTASAFAAGCPVLVKAHPAHPGTSDIVGKAIVAAVRKTGLPEGVFALLQGESHEVGLGLVTHPLVKAVGFTGSLRGGRALFDAAVRRREPIPVYAEMGSSNPIFILPEALALRGEAIAKGLAASVTLGAGQFCTNPGLAVVGATAAGDVFLEAVAGVLASAPACTMVHAGIKAAYDAGLQARAQLAGVVLRARSASAGPRAATAAQPALLLTDAVTWRSQPRLAEELYGPGSLAVRCRSKEEMQAVAEALEGHLTATVHGTDADLAEHADLLRTLRRKVGRLIVNGFPTGVEVSAAMHHGGPYPATTDARSTSVGTAAIQRFARPVCFQDVPEAFLPEELQGTNPRRIWRLVDGLLTKDPV
jgi:NADP-dependent aldehyde dehydrogenase